MNTKRSIRHPYRLLSVPLSILAVLLAHFLNIPNPMMILIIPVVFFTYTDGYIGGILSGIIAVLYSLYFFSNTDKLFTYNELNIQKVMTILAAVTVIIVLVGNLKARSGKQVTETERVNSNFLNVLSGMDTQILVTDLGTDEILFANAKMNTGYHIDYDPTGLPCWQVYYGKKSRCEFCRVPELVRQPDTPLEWEMYSERTDSWFHNRESIIEWPDGRRVHLQQSMDITESKRTEAFLRRRLQQESLMSGISQGFISMEDTDSLIAGVLEKTGEFMQVDRCFLFRFGNAGDEIHYEYGWFGTQACPADGDEGYTGIAAIREAFMQDGQAQYISEDAQNDPLLKGLRDTSIRSMLALPLYLHGTLWGVISFETCRDTRSWDESDIVLAKLISNTISGVMDRARMERQLIDARDEAEQSNKAKSDFLSRMSHEIRTPMNSIVGMTGIAARSDDIARIRECLGRVDDASNHLLGVINDILDMSKIEAGKFELSNSDFVIEHMLQRVTNVNNYRFDQKEQHFSINVRPNVPIAIITDQQRLAQVITNLLSNAAKFTPNDGNIRLTIEALSQEDGYATLRFEVADEGIGLTPEQQSRLFQSFEQADSSITRRFGGTGLGLSISKSIVEMMDGRIWVESAPGKGSTFIFTIRVRQGFATRSSVLSPNVDWAKVRLLAVDDSEDVRRYFAAVTDSLSIACDTAANGGEALSRLRGGVTYQIVFLDWSLQDVEGLALARQIREEFGDQVVVIMISASDWADIEKDAEALGIRHYISKPLLPSPIIDCINECFGEEAVRVEQLPADGSENADIFLGRRLLLVEDIEVNREIIKAILEDTGIEIIEAENGRLAADMFEKTSGDFDMVFMDIHMPVMDGYTATQTIRSLRHLPEASAVPIIAMTANVFREDIEKCLDAGMNDHIGKPVDPGEMVAKMKRYMPVGR